MNTPSLESARIERARSLGEELGTLLEKLAGTFSGADAALFLDRFERCAAYPQDEQAAAGIDELVSVCRKALDMESRLVHEAAAAGLDFNALSAAITALLDEETPGAAENVALDLLWVASIAQRLPKEAQAQARRVLDAGLAAMAGMPERFESVSALAVDRARHESVTGQAPWMKELVLALAEAEEDADALEINASLERAARRTLVAAVVQKWLDPEEGVVDRIKSGLEKLAGQLREAWDLLLSPPEQALVHADSGGLDHDQVHLESISPCLFMVRADGKVTLEWLSREGHPVPELWLTKPVAALVPAADVKGGLQWEMSPDLATAGLELRWPDGRVERLAP